MEFEFPVKVDKIDDVPETFRSLYQTKEGEEGATLLDPVAKRMHDLGNLQTTLQTERKKATQLEKAVKRWETLGATPDDVQKLIKGWEEVGESPEAIRNALAEKDKLISEKGDIGKQIDQMKSAHAQEINKVKEQHKKEVDARSAEAAKYRKAMEQEKIDSALIAEITKQKGIPKLILPIARAVVKVMEDDGEFVTRVVDREGDPRVNGKGDPMSVADLINEMKNDAEIAYAFEAEGRSGSGANPGTTQRRGANGAQTYTLQQWQHKLATVKSDERTKLMQMKAANQIVITNL